MSRDQRLSVITVRLAPSLHRQLKAAAGGHIVRGRPSMNALAVKIIGDWLIASGHQPPQDERGETRQ